MPSFQCSIIPSFPCSLPVSSVLGRGRFDDEGLDQVSTTEQGPDPLQRISETWQRWGKVLIWTSAGILLIVAVRLVNPFRIYDSINERLLRRSLLRVDELLKRIQAEAEATAEDSQNAQKEETVVEEGLLGALAEVADFTSAEQVPAYVLTVNDLMLDNIRLTLKRLRRFTEGNAERYRDYMFSVLRGIKTLTEQSAEAGVSAGLAVDIHAYFADAKRYQAWRKLLSRAAKRGKHREIAHGFLLFMRDLREGRASVAAAPRGSSRPVIAASGAGEAPRPVPPIPAAPPLDEPSSVAEVPKIVDEETLPALHAAAAREAAGFCSWVRTGDAPEGAHAWQFELVRRQQQVHLRPEAQRMLAVFLSQERKTLQEITKIRMLPCRTWDHVLRLLGVADGAQLHERVEGKLLTTQEIFLLEKAFLQTFAKRESLARVYGQSQDAGMMMDLHVPQIRRETLALLCKLQQTEPEPLADATQTLNDEETPQNNQVKRLIEHYVHHRREPPR